MIKPIVITGLILVLVVVGFLSFRSKPAPKTYSIPDGAKAGDLSTFEACVHQPGKKKVDAECTTLTVPENWEDPNSRLIALPVVRFASKNSSPAEPVFVLLGGPGSYNLRAYPKEWLLENRDVIFIGYRGVDGTVDLVCDEISKISADYLGKGFLSDEANIKLREAAKQCADDFKSSGIDLQGYTVKGVVQDMEAVRKALGYEKINLWSESYGARVAQLYAYMHPQSLNRVVMIGLNTPGHFVYDPVVLDGLIRHISDLCAKDPNCSQRTPDLAQAIYEVNHNMPKQWLFLPIDPGTIRLLTQMMFFSNTNMSMVTDAYLAAANGDPSGLAMLNFIAPFVFPFEMFHMGDFLNKGGTLDMEYYKGPESVQLGDSIMGAPLAEWVWSMAGDWPVELVDANLRQLQESDVDMLVINGTVDFSTPPNALDEIKDYYHNAQTVLLPEFSHAGDITSFQPDAIERLITSYYDTGMVDTSLFKYQPINFKPRMSTTTMAKLFVGTMILFPPLLIAVVARITRKRFKKA